jgi:hypothetical protein
MSLRRRAWQANLYQCPHLVSCRMVHKIRFTHELGISEELKKYLPREGTDFAVAGETMVLKVSLTNIGEMSFPGGEFAYVKIEWAYTALGAPITYYWYPSPVPEIPRGASHSMAFKVRPPAPGMAWFYAKFKPIRDQQPVEYYIDTSDKPHEEDIYAIYVADYHLVRILQTLTRVTEELSKLAKERARAPESS